MTKVKKPYRETPSKTFIPPVVVENWAKGALNPNIEKWEQDIYISHLKELKIFITNVLEDSKALLKSKKSKIN